MSLHSIPSTTSADELLRHAAWVRRVAAAIVRGDDRASDVEQETWVAALSRPPRGDSDLHGWFGAVARRMAARLFRREATRRRHEDAAALDAGTRAAASAQDIVARAEMRQRVAAAVLALEEPYRSTLLARYFDDLAPSVIARALDVSVETVRTRLKRGLAQLRTALDSERGDAPTLEAALAPLLARAAGSAGLAVKVAATALLVATLSLAFQMRPRTPRVSDSATRQPEVAQAAVASAVITTPQAPMPAEPVQAQAVREPVAAPSPAPAAAKSADEPVHLVGRLLLPDGHPAANAALHVQGWGSNQEKVLRFGEPKNWKDLDAVSGADGTFALEFLAPRAYQFVLDAKLAGYAAASWRWGSIEPGTTKQLGNVTLRKGATIRGRIVDERGEPVRIGRWDVHAEGPRCTEGDGADETRVSVSLDAGSAEYVLTDVAPGRVQLKAHSPITNWVHGPALDVAPGEEVHADITYRGAALDQRITVTLFARPYFIFEHDAEEILLTGQGVEPLHARKIEHSSQSHCFDGVPPGSYTLEIRDPKFLPWSRSNVAAGSTVSANLVGNARVRLHVVDAATGQALPNYSLRTRFETNWSPDTFEVPMEGGRPPADGVIAGMIPVDQVLLVHVDGYAECSIPQRPLPANQLTELTARMSHGGTLAGVVVRSDGATPAPGTRIELTQKSSGGNERTTGILIVHGGRHGDADQQRDAVADEHGAFRFDGLPAGHYSLSTDDDPPLQASIDDVEVSDSQAATAPLVLKLPPRGTLTGRLIGPDGADYSGLRVVAIDPAESREASFRRMSRRFRRDFESAPTDAVHADGTYCVGPLGVGKAQVVLELAPPRSPQKGGGITIMSSSGQPKGIVLGTATIVDGQETHADFDVRTTLPGRVRATVTVSGAPAIGAVVEILCAPDPADQFGRLNGPTMVAAGTTGADGKADVGPVPIGGVSLVVRAIDNAWAFWPHVRLQVGPGAVVATEVTSTLHEGTLLLRDRATNEPLARTQVSVGADDGDGVNYAVSATSDEKGVVHLRLPAGSYRVCTTARQPEDDVALEWTDHGAAVESVQLPKGE